MNIVYFGPSGFALISEGWKRTLKIKEKTVNIDNKNFNVFYWNDKGNTWYLIPVGNIGDNMEANKNTIREIIVLLSIDELQVIVHHGVISDGVFYYGNSLTRVEREGFLTGAKFRSQCEYIKYFTDKLEASTKPDPLSTINFRHKIVVISYDFGCKGNEWKDSNKGDWAICAATEHDIKIEQIFEIISNDEEGMYILLVHDIPILLRTIKDQIDRYTDKILSVKTFHHEPSDLIYRSIQDKDISAIKRMTAPYLTNQVQLYLLPIIFDIKGLKECKANCDKYAEEIINDSEEISIKLNKQVKRLRCLIPEDKRAELDALIQISDELTNKMKKSTKENLLTDIEKYLAGKSYNDIQEYYQKLSKGLNSLVAEI